MDTTSICNAIEPELANFIHNIITVLKILVPVLLVIFGMLDFGKGIIASKEDEIRKGQGVFIKRLVAALFVFLMISFSQLIVGIVDRETEGEIWSCANKIMNGEIETIDEPIEENNDETNEESKEENNEESTEETVENAE